MKTLLAKTLVTTAFALISLQSAQAADQGAAPSTDSHLSWQLPATVQYLEQRSVAAASRESHNPFPNASEEYQPNASPSQIRYFEQREATVRKEVQERPMKSHAASRESNNPFPSASEEYQPNFSPSQIRYFEQREAAVRKEVQERPMKSHYRPDTSRVSSD